MEKLQRALVLAIFLYLATVLFSQRGLLTTPYDRHYWQERFEQSQWRLPLSKRIIGDDGLYLYAGDQLIHGADPTVLNAEMPPLGKYLVGLSVLLFKNGRWCGFITNLLVLIAFFFLAHSLLKKKTLALAVSLLLALDPLFTNQFSRMMLDNIQLFLLLTFFLFLTKTDSIKSPRRLIFFSLLLGVTLGLFSATKVPLFTPLLILLSFFFYLKKKSPFQFFILIPAAFLTYLLTYSRFFLLGHNFFDWLGVQKWIISFYRQSLLEANRGSASTTLFFNQYQNLFTHLRETINYWTMVWPLAALLGTIGFFSQIKKKTANTFLWALMAAFVLGIFVIYNLIPFWPRYLLLILPFLYLGLAAFAKSSRKPRLTSSLLGAMIVFNGFVSTSVLFPTPQKTTEQFLYDWQHGFFNDMYEQIDTASQKKRPQEEFHHFGQKVFYDAQIEAAKIEVIDAQWSHWQSPQTIKIEISYFTRQLGPFNEKKEITVIKENGQWRIPWQWDLLISDLNETVRLGTNIQEAKRGMIIAADGTILARDIPNSMFWIIPGQVKPDKEEAMNKFLEELFGRRVAAAAFHHRYVSFNQPDWPIPIGVPPKTLNQNEKLKLKEFNGIKLTPKLGRSSQADVGQVANSYYDECCSLLYSTTNYDGLSGIEKEKNELLKGYNGGKLVIKDQEGKIIRTIIEVEKRNGQDVQL